MSLHPDLASLASRYRELADAVNEGHISVDDAMGTLAGLSVTDGIGALWRIDHEGRFLRAEFPGAPAVITDGAAYVGPETVQQPSGSVWGSQPAAPAFGSPPPSGFGNPPPAFGHPAAPSGAFGSAGSAAPQTDPFAAPQPAAASGSPFTEAPATIRRGFKERPANSLAKAEERNNRVARLDTARLTGLLLRNKFVLAVAVIALVFVVHALLSSGTTTKLPSLPAASTGQTDNPTQALPQSLPATPKPAHPAASSLPSGSDVNRALSALTSGDRTLIVHSVAGHTGGHDLAIAAAFFAGLHKAALDVQPGPVAPVNGHTGTAAQVWTVTGSTGQPIRIPVRWSRTADGWILATLPMPN